MFEHFDMHFERRQGSRSRPAESKLVGEQAPSVPSGEPESSAISASSLTATTAVGVSPSISLGPSTPPQSANSDDVQSSCSTIWNEVSQKMACPSGTQQTTMSSIASANETGSAVKSASLQSSPSNKTANRSPTASASAASAQNGLSGGAVAGVAIGMMLFGLLIAGAVFFILLRRQKKKRHNPMSAHPPPHAHSDTAEQLEKGPTVVTSAYATKVDDMLPQPVADDTITDAALKVRDNIKNHVRTYYHVSPVPVASINQTNLRELALATGTSSSVLASMLSDVSTRAETLRLVVAWIVLSRCTGERDESLLPGELAMIATIMPGRDGNNAAQSAMYSKWKAMTGALLHERVGQNTQDRKHRFSSAAADLDSIVAPFVQGGLEAQRTKNLDMILTRSANFAFLLFAQPGVFQFEFSSEHGGLVVFPALVQTIGDQGQVLGASRVLLEKEIAA